MNHFLENMLLKPKRIWNTVRKGTSGILVVRIDALGDMIVTIPFLRELRKNYPQEKITLVCNDSVRNLVETVPYVDRVVTCGVLASGRHRFQRNWSRLTELAEREFSGEKFSLVILPSYQAKGIELTVASSVKAARLVAYRDGQILGTGKSYIDCPMHEVQRYLQLLQAMKLQVADDRLEIFTTDNDREFVRHLFAKEGVDNSKKKLVVCLSTSARQRDWPAEWYAAVCHRLCSKYPLEILIAGAGAAAAQYTAVFCREFGGAHDFTNRTTIRQTAALMQRSDYHLGGDTGTVHLAAACHLKGVALYKDCVGQKFPVCGTPADNFYPWQADIKVLRPVRPLPGCEKGCTHDEPHCIKQITVDEVCCELEKIIAGDYVS